MGHNGKNLIGNLDEKSQEELFKAVTGSRQKPKDWNNGDYDRALKQVQQEQPSLLERLFGKTNKNNDKK